MYSQAAFTTWIVKPSVWVLSYISWMHMWFWKYIMQQALRAVEHSIMCCRNIWRAADNTPWLCLRNGSVWSQIRAENIYLTAEEYITRLKLIKRCVIIKEEFRLVQQIDNIWWWERFCRRNQFLFEMLYTAEPNGVTCYRKWTCLLMWGKSRLHLLFGTVQYADVSRTEYLDVHEAPL